MGEELDVPIKKYEPKDSENIYLKYGLNKVQGWKKSMEDFTLDFAEQDKEKLLNIFGIFDGHGGAEVPKYLSLHFLDFLKNNANFKIGKYKEALTETFFEIDKSFTNKEVQEELTKYADELKPSKEQEMKDINNLCAPGEKLNDEELEQIMAFNEIFDPRNIENANIAEFTGATGIIIFISENKNILIANAGNSRCLVLDKEGKIINKTKDHTMNDEEEKKRVELARSFNEEEEKKKGEEKEQAEYLDSTRGFGDWEFKGNAWIDQKDQEVSVEPEFLEVSPENAAYLIVGSHGIFECGNDQNDEVINEQIRSFFVDEISKNPDKQYSKIIEEYFEKIIAKDKNDDKNTKGLDNMSCIVIKLAQDNIVQFIKIKEEERKKKEDEEKTKKKEEEDKKKKKEEEEKKKKKEEEERKKKEEEEKKKAEEEKKKQEELKKEEENKNIINEENKNEIIEENNNNIIIEEKKEGEDNKPKEDDKKEENQPGNDAGDKQE